MLQLLAGNAQAALLVPGGRMTIGRTEDDGVNAAQVGGSVRALNYFINGQGVGDSGLIGIYNGANGPNIASTAARLLAQVPSRSAREEPSERASARPETS
uniref:hypothetical protein n=1 Tax=Burkholderia glumae TaxID=337 RepID=UPI000FDABF4D